MPTSSHVPACRLGVHPRLPASPSWCAVSIMEGGIEGIFTPMHMLVFQKPEEPAVEPAAASA